jgi:ABC-type transporter Mla MlaB component
VSERHAIFLDVQNATRAAAAERIRAWEAVERTALEIVKQVGSAGLAVLFNSIASSGDA